MKDILCDMPQSPHTHTLATKQISSQLIYEEILLELGYHPPGPFNELKMDLRT